MIAVKGSLSPIATGNFVALAQCGYYDGVVFHRLVPTFVIQGGDGEYGREPNVNPDWVGTGGAPYTIKDEPVTGDVHPRHRGHGPDQPPDSRHLAVLHRPERAAQPALAGNTYQIVGNVTAGHGRRRRHRGHAQRGDTTGNQATNPVAMTKVTVSNP